MELFIERVGKNESVVLLMPLVKLNDRNFEHLAPLDISNGNTVEDFFQL